MLFPKKIDQYRIVEREQELNTRAKPTQDSDVNPDQNLRFLRGVVRLSLKYYLLTESEVITGKSQTEGEV